MEILLNSKNEIINYAIVGHVDGFTEFNGKIPENFVDKFKPSLFLIKENTIVENPDYVAPEPPVIGLSKQDKLNAQIMLNQAKQKEEQDEFNAQTLLQLAKLGGNK